MSEALPTQRGLWDSEEPEGPEESKEESKEWVGLDSTFKEMVRTIFRYIHETGVAWEADIAKVILTPETKFDYVQNEFNLDSLDVIEIIMLLEEEFGLDIPDEDVSSWVTLKDFAEYIHKHRRIHS